MAQDGHIVLGVKVDTNGLTNGKDSIKNATEKIADGFKKTGIVLSQSITSTKGIEKLQKQLEKTNQIISETEAKIQELHNKADSIYDSAYRGPGKELFLQKEKPPNLIKSQQSLTY